MTRKRRVFGAAFKAEVALAEGGAQGGAGLTPLRLVVIKLADQSQHEASAGRRFGECVMELPSGMRPAAQPGDAGVRPHVGGIRLVAVAVQQAVIVTKEFFGLVMTAR